jgi:hypothetical protein
MKRLELDFVRRSRSPWAGRTLLAIAVALAGDVAWSYRQAQGDLQAAQALAARPVMRAPVPNATPEELAQVRETVARLSLPWEKLFGAIESAASEQVAVLAVEPDSKAGTVVISGDSKDYLAALSYVLNLQQSDALSQVQLVRHEVKPNDPQRAVAFTVTGRWNGAPQ